uniref:hypothetical protein n=1 Tax=Mycobacterium tuberculosis TaxID=1773 RepID=UPI001BDBB2A3
VGVSRPVPASGGCGGSGVGVGVGVGTTVATDAEDGGDVTVTSWGDTPVAAAVFSMGSPVMSSATVV